MKEIRKYNKLIFTSIIIIKEIIIWFRSLVILTITPLINQFYCYIEYRGHIVLD